MEIGLAIKKLRRDRRLTQDKLADLAHTSKPNISNLERNVQGYSPVLLRNLAKALQVRVSDIFLLAEQMSRKSDSDSDFHGISRSHTVGDISKLISLWDQMSLVQKVALLNFLQELLS